MTLDTEVWNSYCNVPDRPQGGLQKYDIERRKTSKVETSIISQSELIYHQACHIENQPMRFEDPKSICHG